ncbi:MAG: hypothetical protein AB7F78_24800 [Hyphomicrobiaceae bacterium]
MASETTTWIGLKRRFSYLGVIVAFLSGIVLLLTFVLFDAFLAANPRIDLCLDTSHPDYLWHDQSRRIVCESYRELPPRDAGALERQLNKPTSSANMPAETEFGGHRR